MPQTCQLLCLFRVRLGVQHAPLLTALPHASEPRRSRPVHAWRCRCLCRPCRAAPGFCARGSGFFFFFFGTATSSQHATVLSSSYPDRHIARRRLLDRVVHLPHAARAARRHLAPDVVLFDELISHRRKLAVAFFLFFFSKISLIFLLSWASRVSLHPV